MNDLMDVSFPSEGVAQILQRNGAHNFSSFKANDQLYAALQRVRDQGTRVVVVGSGVPGEFIGHGWLPDVLGAFSGGATSGDPFAGWRSFTELDAGPMVSIAAVDGPAWGHGSELAWACDLRVASTSASFAQPEVNIGACPGSGGTVRMSRLVGEATCLSLVLDGRPVAAAEAHRLGLVHRLVEPGQALPSALAWAEHLAARPPWALEANKRAVKGARDMPFVNALRHEGSVFTELLSRRDTQDLVRAAQARYDAGGSSQDAFGIADKLSESPPPSAG